MLIQKAISETILYIIEWKLCYKWISLKDISATGNILNGSNNTNLY